MKIFAPLLFLLVFCATAVADPSEAIVMVVNQTNSTENLSAAVLARIYKGRQSKWSDGSSIVVIDRPVRSKTREQFYRKILRSAASKKFFRVGSPVPFRAIQIRSDAAVVAFVLRVPTAIGYVRASAIKEGIKAVAIDEKSYLADGYLLEDTSGLPSTQ